MLLMFIGIGLNLLGIFYLYYYVTEVSNHVGPSGLGSFILIASAFWLLSLIGGILAAVDKRKIGAILVTIGSITVIPLGIVAILGATKVKEPTQAELETRRQTAIKMGKASQENNEDTEIFYLRKYLGLSIAIAILLIIIGISLFVFFPIKSISIPLASVGVLLFIIAILAYNMHYITIDKDYIAVKYAPARSRVYVLFSEITSVTKEPKKIIIFYKDHSEQNTREKKIIIVPNKLEESEQRRLRATIYRSLNGKFV